MGTEHSGILNLFHLDGQVAVITGAHAWLGFDMACALAEAGWHIIITSRERTRAEESARRIAEEFGVETLPLTMDQRRHDQVKALMHEAQAWKGRIDILINNAGGSSLQQVTDFLERDPKDEIDLISTNLIGVLFCCKEAARYMVDRGRGKIINIASIAGLIGRDRRMYQRAEMNMQPVDYPTAKAGVIGMTRDLAAVLAPKGINVNAISPGGFLKPGALPERFVEDFADEAMLGRWGRMGADIKGAALFLASAASDYVTGHNLVVDGGFSVFK